MSTYHERIRLAAGLNVLEKELLTCLSIQAAFSRISASLAQESTEMAVEDITSSVTPANSLDNSMVSQEPEPLLESLRDLFCVVQQVKNEHVPGREWKLLLVCGE